MTLALLFVSLAPVFAERGPLPEAPPRVRPLAAAHLRSPHPSVRERLFAGNRAPFGIFRAGNEADQPLFDPPEGPEGNGEAIGEGFEEDEAPASPLLAAPSLEIEDGSALTVAGFSHSVARSGETGSAYSELGAELRYADIRDADRVGEERDTLLTTALGARAGTGFAEATFDAVFGLRSRDQTTEPRAVSTSSMEVGTDLAWTPNVVSSLRLWTLDGAVEGVLLDDPELPRRSSRWWGADARTQVVLDGSWSAALHASLYEARLPSGEALAAAATSSVELGLAYAGERSSLGLGVRQSAVPGESTPAVVSAVAGTQLGPFSLSVEAQNLLDDIGSSDAVYVSRFADGLVGGESGSLGLYAEGGYGLLVRLRCRF